MSGALRRASGALMSRLSQGASQSGCSLPAGGGSARSSHDLSVRKNKHVEHWLSRREDFDDEFRWSSTTVRHVLIGVVLIPVMIYNAVTWQAHRDDDYGGRPRRHA